jgi:hypothetical protein
MTILPKKKTGYDPEPKKRRKHLIEWILQFLGITATPFILAPYLWKTAQDVIRDMEAQVIIDSGLATTMDWVIEDSSACDYCQGLAAAGPYNLYLVPETHPNCRCTLVPHVE